jgi:hypothetical protein
LLVLLLIGCGSSASKFDLVYGASEPCVPSDGSFERQERDFFLGVKLSGFAGHPQSIKGADDIIEMGMNAVSISFPIPFDDQGNVNYPAKPNYEDLEDEICKIGNIVHALKSSGLSVYISGQPFYTLSEIGEDEPTTLTGYPEEVTQNYLSQLEPVMMRLAEMGERYSVDFIAPLSEPDKFLGEELSDAFMQEAISYFDGFSGRLVWQVYGLSITDIDWVGDPYRTDFSGYDVVGLAVLGCDSAPADWDEYIETLVQWGQEDGVPEVMMAEFGCVMVPDSEETAIENMDSWYDMTAGTSVGLFVLDNPQNQEGVQSVSETWLEDWIRGIATELGFL